MIYELSLDEWRGDVTPPNLCKVHPEIQAALLPMRFKNKRVKFYAYSCGFTTIRASLRKHGYTVSGHFQLDELEALPVEASPFLTRLQVGHYKCPHTQDNDADAVEYQAIDIDLIQEAAVGAGIPKIVDYEINGVENSAPPGMSHAIFYYAVDHLVPILDAILDRDNLIVGIFGPFIWSTKNYVGPGVINYGSTVYLKAIFDDANIKTEESALWVEQVGKILLWMTDEKNWYRKVCHFSECLSEEEETTQNGTNSRHETKEPAVPSGSSLKMKK